MKELVDDLSRLEQKALKRSLRMIEQTEGARLTIGGKSFLNFSSNNYLGLARHPHVVEAVKEVLDHWGAGATASRLICGTTVIHEDLERALSAFFQREAALLFPTGYMTNLAAVSSLVGQGDAVILDRLCHASLVDAARLSGARLLVYAHADPDDAEKALQRAASYRRRLLVSDSLFSMDGDFAPVQALADLARRYGAITLLDEAHAVGIWGEGGRGLACHPGEGRGPENAAGFRLTAAGMTGYCDVIVGTLSKAFGTQGGFVCGSRTLIDTLINKGRSFIYTTGLSPACVAAAQASLSLIQEDPAPRFRVQKLSQRLRDGLKKQGFNILNSQSQIVPILLGETERAVAVSHQLEEAGIFAPAIRPPTVHAGQCRIRFSVTSDHTEQDIEQLLKALSSTPSQ